MGLQFKTVTVTIPQTTGVFNSNQDTSLGRRIRKADVAPKAFKLDYVGGAPDSDIVQASVSLESFGDEAVESRKETIPPPPIRARFPSWLSPNVTTTG